MKTGRGNQTVDSFRAFSSRRKEWKRQTLNTFLSRLEEKDLVIRQAHMVKVAYTEAELNQLMMKEAIDNLYQGELSDLILAFAEKVLYSLRAQRH